MNFKDITALQWLGIILVINGALIGSTAQLTDLLGPNVVKIVVAICSIGNAVVGGLVSFMSGQGSLTKTVAGFTGDDGRPAVRVGVNANAGSALAAVAVDPAQPNIGAVTPAARETLIAKTAT